MQRWDGPRGTGQTTNNGYADVDQREKGGRRTGCQKKGTMTTGVRATCRTAAKEARHDEHNAAGTESMDWTSRVVWP